MPGREDEYYSGRKERRGEPLCPFCGKKQVYQIKKRKFLLFSRNEGWSCANEDCKMYRKRFPNPSFGSGSRR